MKKLIYSTFSNTRFDISLLLIRFIVGFEMGFYGLNKMIHFSENVADDFWAKDVNFLGMGASVSLGLVVFSELFCSIFLIFGIFTRLSLIPLLFTMLYILIVLDHFEIVYYNEDGFGIASPFKYIVIYTVLFISGPGKYSLDHRFFKI